MKWFPFKHAISKQLVFLFAVFVVGFSLQFILTISTAGYIDHLKQANSNANIRYLISQEVVKDVKALEADFYKLAATSTPQLRKIIVLDLDKRKHNILKNLNILNRGGQFKLHLELNLPNTPDVERVYNYQPIQSNSFQISAIEIQPKLELITNRVRDLVKGLGELDIYTQDSNAIQISSQLKKLNKQIKFVTPIFDRIFENANRILFEYETEQARLAEEIQRDEALFNKLQWTLSIALLVLGIIGFWVVARQITDITDGLTRSADRIAEEKNKAIEANRSKSEFLANMSHEIRTPLNAILGFIELLKHKVIDTEGKKYIETIDHSSHSLLAIINDVLDFSKIENNKLDIDKIDFDPKREFNVTADLFLAKCTEKEINLILKIDPNLPNRLHGDILRIKQVISNLLSNAIKFTPSQKSVSLIVEYHENTKQLYIEVSDQGIGISTEHQKFIFEAFSQAESSTTRQYGGTGLGLSISAKLVELMGGQLQLESFLGFGSRFFFSLPVKIGQDAELTDTSDLVTPESFEGEILLVEDNMTNQLLMKTILSKLGLNIDIANDGSEAVAKIESDHNYDLILMDENMPNLSGIEATKQIRLHEANYGIKPNIIVALTANAMKGDRQRFLNAGMDEYLTKPINVQRLKETLSLFLVKH